MKKILLEILIRYYVNRYANKEIVKLTPEQEVDLYRMRSHSNSIKVLKNNVTIQTLKHFEATTEQERWMAKGASLAIQLIKDRAIFAEKISKEKDKKTKLRLWKNFKL